ncbi:MAG TPA: hypothetical protein VNI77_01850, partial [Nitrososphaera sp.]|nr:hypothetical protein [Nitrososphaera sp.]
MDAELGKEKLKIPLNNYDLFGYLIPGAIALLAIYSFEFWADHQLEVNRIALSVHLPLFTAINSTAHSILQAKDWILSALFLIVMLIIAYAFGHIVSSVSSLSLDRILVYKGYGYPYQQLFGFEHPIRNWDTGPFYRGLFFWFNAYLLVRYYAILYPGPAVLTAVSWLGWYLTFVLVIKLSIGHFRTHPFNWLVSHTPRILRKIGTTFLVAVIRILFAGPYDLFTSSLSRLINTRAVFQPEFVEFYKKTFHSLFGLDPNSAETNNYWLSKCYIAYKSPTLDSMLVNWLYLYSYARNLSTAFYLAFAYCFISILFQRDLFVHLGDSVLYIIPLVFFLLALVMLSRYYYLYYIYYSKFLFRAF